jgi:hypothetical protein
VVVRKLLALLDPPGTTHERVLGALDGPGLGSLRRPRLTQHPVKVLAAGIGRGIDAVEVRRTRRDRMHDDQVEPDRGHSAGDRDKRDRTQSSALGDAGRAASPDEASRQFVKVLGLPRLLLTRRGRWSQAALAV